MSSTPSGADTLTIPQFAQLVQISESKAYELAQRGQLPVPVLRIGRAVRINRRAYEEWVAGQQESGQSQD